MSSRLLIILLTSLLVLGYVPAIAAADDDFPSTKFTVDPAAPVEDQPVTFTARADCADEDIRCDWTGGGGLATRGKRITHTYADPGTYQVRLLVTRTSDDTEQSDSRAISLEVLPAPTAPPALAPPAPAPALVPQPAPIAPIRGTGTADVAPVPATPGSQGAAPSPADPQPAAGSAPEPRSTPPSRPAELRIMSPFPIIRIAGIVGSRGTRLTLVSVRGPRTARVVVRCVGRGRGCPFRRREHPVRPSLDRELKLRGRLLRPGAMLDIRVFQAGRVGKRTTLRFRERRGPARRDGCVTPAGSVRRCG